MKHLIGQFKQMIETLAEKNISLTPAVLLSEFDAVRLFDEANGYLKDAPLLMISRAEKIKQVNGGECYGIKIFVETK